MGDDNNTLQRDVWCIKNSLVAAVRNTSSLYEAHGSQKEASKSDLIVLRKSLCQKLSRDQVENTIALLTSLLSLYHEGDSA